MQDERDIYEWKSSKMMEYHERQIQKPYRSTILFEEFLKENTCLDNRKIIDIACGAGGTTRYLADNHKSSKFVGMDFNEEFGVYFSRAGGGKHNTAFEVGNLYEMNPKWRNNFDGALCLQTLSWLPEYKDALRNICDLNTNWIALSLLGYEGKINFNISVENYESLTPEGDFTHSWYNIYSLPLMKEFLNEQGFSKFIYKEFEIDIDLPKRESMDMGTYTIMTAEKKRLQVSGALMMPWYFIYAER